MLVMESKAKTGWPRGIWVFSAEHQNRVVLGLLVSKVIEDIFEDAKPELEHNETVSQIERAFRKHKFYTTREYPIYRIKDKSNLWYFLCFSDTIYMIGFKFLAYFPARSIFGLRRPRPVIPTATSGRI